MPSPAPQNVWSSAEPWDQLTWAWDWDFFISSARSLRIYLFEHGTIPLWNLFICGGQLELVNPQSFAFTWPSLFLYALPPAPAIMCLWLVLSFVGTWSAAGLLRLAGVSLPIAWIFSTAFAFSGFFAAHFNQGHATFVFFHLILLLAYCAAKDLSLASESAARTQRKNNKSFLAWGVVGASFLLFSAPSIQALVYGLPLLVVLWAVHGFPVRTLTSVLVGMLMASYKFMPVLFQSLARKREDIFAESYSPAFLFKTLFTFVDRPELMWERYNFPGRFYGWWEYCAFISPLVVLMAIGGFLLHGRYRSRLLTAGLLLMLVGAVLSLGNKFWLDLLGPLPVLRSVRVFPRFQFLLLAGVTLSGAIVAEKIRRLRIFSKKRDQMLVTIILAALVSGPSLIQASYLVRGLTAYRDSELADEFGLARGFAAMEESGGIWLSQRIFRVPLVLSAQDLVLRSGSGIVEECYDPFFPVKERFQVWRSEPIRPFTSPVNVRLSEIYAKSFLVSVPDDLHEDLILNLPLIPETQIDPRPVLTRHGLTFAASDVAGKKIRFSVDVQDMMFGVYLSILTAFGCVVLFIKERLRG
jgi:hypothetical protein